MANFGRKKIITDYDIITADNVEEFLNSVLPSFRTNQSEIQYLFDYYRGNQPILQRQKEVHDSINNKIVTNRAQEIVSFKTGYLVGDPIQYVSVDSEDKTEETSKSVTWLNMIMDNAGKAASDKELVEDANICGTSYRFIAAVDRNHPFDIAALDPINTFVVYSSDILHKPVAGVYYARKGSDDVYSVYTDNKTFTLVNGKLTKEEDHFLGDIPIIEYPNNNSRMGSFESVIGLLDAINTVQSNRIDGVEQFIQSLIVLTGCQLPEDETAETIREKGMITLPAASGESKADIKILSESLNQSDTQTLVDDLYQSVLTIVGMPSTGNGTTSDSSNNGAVIMRNGWHGAESRAKDSEIMFKDSERVFLRIVLRILDTFSILSLDPMFVMPHFNRHNYEDIMTKATVLTTMLNNDKIDPKLAFESCGLFADSEEAYRESLDWYDKNKVANNAD